MSTLLTLPDVAQMDPPIPLAKNLQAASDDIVRRQVWSLLAGAYPVGSFVERRGDQRFPYPHQIYLTPVGPDGLSPQGDSIVVIGKHLSERGLGFFHPQPVPHRRMIASLESRGGQWMGLIIDITWCRFTRHGWYDSGGRFLQPVTSPIESID